MGIEENKALVKRWLRSNESGVPDLELLAPDINNHNIPPATPGGRQGTGALLEPFLNAFSDWNMNIHVMIAEGDEVAVRCTTRFRHTGEFQGVQATGTQMTISFMQIWTIKDRKLSEVWEQYDALGFMQQLGVIPPPSN